MEEEEYFLEKSIWHETDFDKMSWHDATVYGFTFENGNEHYNGDFVLDIDYIFKWVHPQPPETHFSFWAAPCTLIFNEALHVNINIDTSFFALEGLQIADISLIEQEPAGAGTRYHWLIELQEGQIELQSSGFTQIVRKKPVFGLQAIDMAERGGISFGREPI